MAKCFAFILKNLQFINQIHVDSDDVGRKAFILIILNFFKLCIYLFKNDKTNFIKYITLKQLFLHLKFWTKSMSNAVYTEDEANLQLNVSFVLIKYH